MVKIVRYQKTSRAKQQRTEAIRRSLIAPLIKLTKQGVPWLDAFTTVFNRLTLQQKAEFAYRKGDVMRVRKEVREMIRREIPSTSWSTNPYASPRHPRQVEREGGSP